VCPTFSLRHCGLPTIRCCSPATTILESTCTAGTGKSVANSVGGFLPGDVLLKDNGESPERIATHPHPFYTPIATFGSEYVMEPVAYGLKFAGEFTGASFLRADLTSQLQTKGINATAYAARLPGRHLAVIILNKDAEQDVEVSLDFGTGRTGAVETKTLHAPALDSREAHITRSPETGRPSATANTP